MADAEEQRGAQPGVSLPSGDGEAGMEQPPVVDDGVIYPHLAPVVFRRLRQRSKLRRWCLDHAFSSCLNRTSVLVIILSCVVQGSFKPCVKDSPIREVFEAVGLIYFLIEMLIKMVALGVYGHPTCYLACNWHKLDLMLFIGELLDLLLGPFGIQLKLLTALRPMRLMSRVPTMKELVSMIMTTLPILLHVLLVLILVIHVFGVVGVSLWAGELQNRCFLGEDVVTRYNLSMSPYYISVPGERTPFLCSRGSLAGSRHCSDIPPLQENGVVCTLAAPHLTKPGNWGTPVTAEPGDGNCVDWNLFYNVCRPDGPNPNRGSTNFDNIGYAWLAVFQVITLEGWSDIKHQVMDTHSSWSFLPFVLMTSVGSFLVLNICAVAFISSFSEATSDPRFAVIDSLFNFRPYFNEIKRCLNVCFSRLRRRNFPKNRGGMSWVSDRMEELARGYCFEYTMAAAVVVNVVILAIEHHGQSQAVTTALQVCNHIVTAVFTVEMIIKLLAFGRMYFADFRNLFDFVIAITSLWEAGSKTGKKLTIVRVCRVLRFTKVLRFMPRLKSQLVVLWKSTKEASMLCCLMLFFIFMFSVMGMHLFGCRFTWLAQTGEVIQDRKNFDSLLWSMVTVFQILTQEDWNLVLYNAMASTSPWAALYFVAILILGRCVFLNVLVAIVIQNFQTKQTGESDSDDSSVHSPPLFPEDVAPAPGPSDSASEGCSVYSLTSYLEQDRSTEASDTDLDDESLNLIQRWYERYKDWPCFIIRPDHIFRNFCMRVIASTQFDLLVTVFIVLNSITIAMERPGIDPNSTERLILDVTFHIFTLVFSMEMVMKVVAWGAVLDECSYFRQTWHQLDGLVVLSSLVHIVVVAVAPEKAQSLKILKVFCLLRVFHLLRLIKRVSRLRGAVEALIASVKPVANVALLCGIFFFFYGILGVQLFKGKFYHCIGEGSVNVVNMSDCVAANHSWELKAFNFDSILQALLSLFVMLSTDGWVDLMYDGLDAVGVDQQPIKDYNLWMMPYFLSFMVMSFFLLDMFIGVMVETFHECQLLQKQEETLDTSALEYLGRRRRTAVETTGGEPTPPSSHNSRVRGLLSKLCASVTMEAFVLITIVLNVLLMSISHFNQPEYLSRVTESLNYMFTGFMIMEGLLKLVAFGVVDFAKDRWNLLDLGIILASITNIIRSHMNMMAAIPFNPTILRVCRLLKPSKVLNGKNMRLLRETIIKSLSQVWGICLLFLFFFAAYAALGVELFGKLECSPEHPCLGLYRHSNFSNFLRALLTLYSVCTGDNWSGILKDTMRKCRPGVTSCQSFLVWVSPIYFVSFVIVAQFLLLNLVVAAIMQALEDSKTEVEAQEQQSRQESPAAEQHPNDDGENHPEDPTTSAPTTKL